MRNGKIVFGSSIQAFGQYWRNRYQWLLNPTAPHFLMLSYTERLIWGQGDGRSLQAVDTPAAAVPRPAGASVLGG